MASDLAFIHVSKVNKRKDGKKRFECLKKNESSLFFRMVETTRTFSREYINQEPK